MPVQHHLRLGPDDLAGNGGIGRYVLLSNLALDRELLELAEERAITVAIEGTRVWARRDRRAAPTG